MAGFFDQLAKRLLSELLAPLGSIQTEHEVTTTVQKIDLWFEPDIERLSTHTAERARLGPLAPMVDRPCLIEAFHNPPGEEDVRACIRKQHNLANVRAREAPVGHKPAFPALWLISAGRPVNIIERYRLRPMATDEGWPEGIWQRDEIDALYLVVLRDLPRTRATLPLRLMGAGKTLRDASDELARLPKGAWERELAMRAWIILHGSLPGTLQSQQLDEEAMQQIEAFNKIYDDWKRDVLSQGFASALIASYEARFGLVPTALRLTLMSIRDTDALQNLVALYTTGEREAIEAATREAASEH